MILNILIIENESIVGLHLKKTLQAMGHNVLIVVSNAIDAIKVFQKSRVDLLISDINIDGDINGAECSLNLQKVYRMPVIFITGYRDNETLKQASLVDFVGYLVKPFRQDELETMVNLAILKIKA